MNKSFKLFCSQVSGKQPKLLSEDEKTILKGYNQNEETFYRYIETLKIGQPAYCIIQFLVKFQGVMSIDEIPIIHHNQNVKDQNTLEWLAHLKKRYETRNPENKFLMLQNIIHSYKKPNVLDIKLGIRDPKKARKQNSRHSFLLNGCRINVKNFQDIDNDEWQILFFSKYFFKSLKKDGQILEHLALYFFDGEHFRIELLKKVIEKLRQLILGLRCLKGWKFYSSSLCIFYDAQNDQKLNLKILDFGRSLYTGKDELEEASIIGLQYLHKFLMQIKNKHERIQQKLIQMKNEYLKQAILIIPDKKVLEYEGTSREVSENNSPQKNSEK